MEAIFSPKILMNHSLIIRTGYLCRLLCTSLVDSPSVGSDAPPTTVVTEIGRFTFGEHQRQLNCLSLYIVSRLFLTDMTEETALERTSTTSTIWALGKVMQKIILIRTVHADFFRCFPKLVTTPENYHAVGGASLSTLDKYTVDKVVPHRYTSHLNSLCFAVRATDNTRHLEELKANTYVAVPPSFRIIRRLHFKPANVLVLKLKTHISELGPRNDIHSRAKINRRQRITLYYITAHSINLRILPSLHVHSSLFSIHKPAHMLGTGKYINLSNASASYRDATCIYQEPRTLNDQMKVVVYNEQTIFLTRLQCSLSSRNQLASSPAHVLVGLCRAGTCGRDTCALDEKPEPHGQVHSASLVIVICLDQHRLLQTTELGSLNSLLELPRDFHSGLFWNFVTSTIITPSNKM
ncbi:hypothetical protein J6590_004667 [Homalodisca vitripennis]|nr:hypothetical protein J6590_004667 [Homalodisca vitripennis]